MKGWKWLKLVGLGLAIWGLSLGWPEINEVLTQLTMRRALERVAASLGYVFN